MASSKKPPAKTQPRGPKATSSKSIHGAAPEQLLHLVFGGELKNPSGLAFKDLSKLDIVGIYPNFAEALAAWRSAAQSTVDNAHMRYFVVHIHRLMDPDADRH